MTNLLVGSNIVDFLNRTGAIAPYVTEKVRPRDGKGMSYGADAVGYGIRISTMMLYCFPFYNDREEVRVTKMADFVYDYEDPSMTEHWIEMEVEEGEPLIIPGNDAVLFKSLERFDIPVNCYMTFSPKSSHLRQGLVATVSPLEPGWRGHLTIQVANNKFYPQVARAGDGIGQIHIFENYDPAALMDAYDGEYQDSDEIQLKNKGGVVVGKMEVKNEGD